MAYHKPLDPWLIGNHRHARGLICAFPFWEGYTTSSSYAMEIGPQENLYTQVNGSGWTFSGPNGPVYYTNQNGISIPGKRFEGLTNITIIMGVYIVTTTGGALISKNDNTGIMVQRYTDQRVYFRLNGVGNSANTGVADLPLTTWTQLAVTYDGATQVIWVNGISKGTASHSGLSVPADGVAMLVGKSTTALQDARFNYLYIYNRVLTINEMNEINYDPFAMFRRERLSQYVSHVKVFRRTLSGIGTRVRSRQVHRV